MVNEIQKILTGNRNGDGKGIYSICSSHPVIIKAAMYQAIIDNSLVLVESTSNQVDQFGGYTGMKPADFVSYVKKIGDQINFPQEKLLLGGDHLGPNAWQSLTADAAMKNSRELIKQYVQAGYSKIHLDTSMYCKDDIGDRHKPLNNDVVAKRAAELCKVAEDSVVDGQNKPIYVIGTEVPIPGGMQQKEEIQPTSSDAVKETITIFSDTFNKSGLQDAWKRVVAVVVQPGVEFGDDNVYEYNHEKVSDLKNTIMQFDNIVFEAHSTDYQREHSLRALVEDHFAILKVGPYLTYAYREVLFALEIIENELFEAGVITNKSGLSDVVDDVMVNNPGNWNKYYLGNDKEKWLKRRYSFSDRVRYYWGEEKLQAAVKILIQNLKLVDIPITLLSQYLPAVFDAVQYGKISKNPESIINYYVQEVVAIYARACGMSS